MSRLYRECELVGSCKIILVSWSCSITYYYYSQYVLAGHKKKNTYVLGLESLSFQCTHIRNRRIILHRMILSIVIKHPNIVPPQNI